MSNRVLIVLGAVLLALVAAVIVWPSDGADRAATEAEADASLGLTDITDDDASKVQLKVADTDAVVLVKSGGSWTIGGDEVPDSRIDELFTALDEAGSGELVARNAGSHEDLGVTEKAGVAVTFTVDGKDRTFVVGASPESSGSYFVRGANEDLVYRFDGELNSIVRRDAKAWTAPEPEPESESGAESGAGGARGAAVNGAPPAGGGPVAPPERTVVQPNVSEE